ncbi:hydroxyphenylacetyl-CoA thioesterase PaaI [Lishizhenia sp.]|uniref:hydroxyphenylacetyl-CoA thioesterase PaaI n=1 Tax=Lishizhenia sp. TaxID=2497594 RepID=UPI00299EB2BB|nr:hydroxyphenylacetyl-CoA thioesterase PaaI [Lishizhenia sp.]MDX1445300.1 hydroxyphenylacetyl-CoA thioesterase PaaI [Lishizhenia sp.]
MKSPQEIVNLMLQEDAFSQLLGMKLIAIAKGSCTLELEVTKDFVNGFNIAHGGLSYALADSALAFASNTYGFQCVSIETSISHTRPCFTGDKLTAVCSEENRSKRLGIYTVKVTNQTGKVVALFKGTVHVSENIW